MATLEQLESSGQIIRHQPDFEHWELPNRMISYAPQFASWFGVLEGAPRIRGRDTSPYDQVEQIFFDFALGRPMAYSVDYRKLEPLGEHVWEFKTPDMRVVWLVPAKSTFHRRMR
jgi:hypothetical protein